MGFLDRGYWCVYVSSWCVGGSSAEGRSNNKGRTADGLTVTLTLTLSGTGYTYILRSSGQTDHKCVNKLARPREWGVPLGLFSINHTDSGFFWLNPKLSLDRGNHVTSNTVQFQPCLHESNSLMAPRSPYGRNQQNSFFNPARYFILSSLGRKFVSGEFGRLGGDELRIRARDGFYQ